MDKLRGQFLAVQSTLDGTLDYAQTDGVKYPSIYKLNADRHVTIPVRFMTGEMGMGDPFTFKFFRGVAMYGTGHAQIRIFVDKVPVTINRPIGHAQFGESHTYGDVELSETPDPQRVMWLPRGTKGRTISIEGSGSIKHIRSILVFWDALTGAEDG